ncbi:MAG: hypothetical protein R6W92_05095, partial [Desulfocurvibacter africanus]
ANGGIGRARVTQLKSLSGSFLYSKLPEDFYLSSGRSGHDPAVARSEKQSLTAIGGWAAGNWRIAARV